METIQDKIVDQIGPEGESDILDAVIGAAPSDNEDKPKEKIDLKKLVLYSEIMKTKFY